MTDYQPIDLSSVVNVGIKAVPTPENAGPVHLMGSATSKYAVPTSDPMSEEIDLGVPVDAGPQSMRGLPFVVGSPDGSDGNLFVGTGGQWGGNTIPIGFNARRVIFAHVLLESTIVEDARWGKEVAEYVFHFSWGSIPTPITIFRGKASMVE